MGCPDERDRQWGVTVAGEREKPADEKLEAS